MAIPTGKQAGAHSVKLVHFMDCFPICDWEAEQTWQLKGLKQKKM